MAFLAALVTDFDTALNVTSQLHTDTGATVQLVVVSLLVVPNAVVFSGSYLLGPGFTVGTNTIVSPSVVTVGALPMFPLLAALPDTGPTPGWTAALIGVPPLVAALGAMRAQRHHPTYRWEEGALHGCGGGMLAGLLFGLLALLAGGAVGPGRMTDVGPLAGAVLVHAVTAFGVGGLVGGLIATFWQRRRLEPLPERSPSDALEPDDSALDDDTRHPDAPRSRPTTRPRLTIRADSLVRGSSRSPRGPRLGGRHQPPGAAGRGRGPGVRRDGRGGRRRPGRHRGAGARRTGRTADVRAPGQGLHGPRRLGPGAHRRRSPSTGPTWSSPPAS